MHGRASCWGVVFLLGKLLSVQTNLLSDSGVDHAYSHCKFIKSYCVRKPTARIDSGASALGALSAIGDSAAVHGRASRWGVVFLLGKLLSVQSIDWHVKVQSMAMHIEIVSKAIMHKPAARNDSGASALRAHCQPSGTRRQCTGERVIGV